MVQGVKNGRNDGDLETNNDESYGEVVLAGARNTLYLTECGS